MKDVQGNFRWVPVTIAAISMMLAAIATPAQTFTTLHALRAADGAYPYAGLVQATDGNLYGATIDGGLHSFYCGTIFRITTSGTLTTVYAFCPDGYSIDGRFPYAALIQATDGNLYGTTNAGGALGSQGGTVFKITLKGAFTSLTSFVSPAGCPSGKNPYGPLVEGHDGNFYGTAELCGPYYPDHPGGTVFTMTPSGTLSSVYPFCFLSMCADGSEPYGGLTLGSDGSFYGTTSSGGIGGGKMGAGTVFKVSPGGTLTTLHLFCPVDGCQDGRYPYSTLVQGSDGNFYGTTEEGGAYGDGSVFRITPDGDVTRLYSFCTQTNCADGKLPYAGLVEGTDSNFYGTTFQGGTNNAGTIFQITPGGAFTTLYSFCSTNFCADGQSPYASLIEDTDGNFYGTTTLGGDGCSLNGTGCGTVFRLSVGLGPFVKPQPAFGGIDQSVMMLGTDLRGATSVIFNGTPATFTVESPTAIKTTVPAGATTGPVKVVTPGGTLTSNVNFQVLP